MWSPLHNFLLLPYPLVVTTFLLIFALLCWVAVFLAHAKRVKPFFNKYDGWLGYFWDHRKRRLYLTAFYFGLRFDYKPRNPPEVFTYDEARQKLKERLREMMEEGGADLTIVMHGTGEEYSFSLPPRDPQRN